MDSDTGYKLEALNTGGGQPVATRENLADRARRTTPSYSRYEACSSGQGVCGFDPRGKLSEWVYQFPLSAISISMGGFTGCRLKPTQRVGTDQLLRPNEDAHFVGLVAGQPCLTPGYARRPGTQRKPFQ